jgi:hypothetical protein
MMARTVEVGRAVLASSTQHIELWLTTLITISPSQHSIDTEQFSAHSLLSFMLSGKAWVGRDNGMRVEVGLTLRGEPFPHREFQDLISSIVQAPVIISSSSTRKMTYIPSDMVSIEAEG